MLSKRELKEFIEDDSDNQVTLQPASSAHDSIWERPDYVPPKPQLQRQGSSDFLAVRSKGDPT